MGCNLHCHRYFFSRVGSVSLQLEDTAIVSQTAAIIPMKTATGLLAKFAKLGISNQERECSTGSIPLK